MTFSTQEIKSFVKLKKSLNFDRYKLALSLALLSVSVVLQTLGVQEFVLSILAFFILAEVCLSGRHKDLVSLYERAISSSAEGISSLSRDN